MKAQCMLLAALASVPATLAHTVFTDFFVNGMPQGDGVAMRMNPNGSQASFPIASLNSDDMACNVDGTKGVSRVQPVPDGALLTFEIRSWANDPTKPRLDRGHKGPCAVYLKKVDSAINDKGAGDGWFKIFDHGYESSTSRWCTDEIIDNNGLFSVNLPTGLEGGYYLARPEILALHAASSGDPQFYTGCAQIFLQSTGNLVPEETVSIPGYVQYNQPSTDFNIYTTDASKYPVPGPPIANLTAKGQTTQTTQTEGLKPEGCICENANWCGLEVPDYSDEKGCWDSAKQCWDQGQTCWDTAGPTGGKGCTIWQAKCKDIDDQCTAKNFVGPPNKGKNLTPPGTAIDVGKIMATTGGGFIDSSSPKTSAPSGSSMTYTPAQASVPASEAARAGSKTATPAMSTPVQAAAATPSAYSAKAQENSKAPVPTEAPLDCPKGWKCVVEVVTATKTVYVTAADDSY